MKFLRIIYCFVSVRLSVYALLSLYVGQCVRPSSFRQSNRMIDLYIQSGVWGIWGEWLFIFRELGSTGNYFRGAREQAHNFGDLGSLAKKQKNIRKSLHFV